MKKKPQTAEQMVRFTMLAAQEHNIELGAGCGCSGCDYARILIGAPSVYEAER